MPAAGPTGVRRDPVVAAAVLALWLLLGLFVVYPLAMLFVRMLTDHGTFTTAGIVAILTDRHQVQAFWNSLLLATLVGIAGRSSGFLFAFTGGTRRACRAGCSASSTRACCCRSSRRRSRPRSR
jgi:ABC-type Fe3+ transport system permease subunit